MEDGYGMPPTLSTTDIPEPLRESAKLQHRLLTEEGYHWQLIRYWCHDPSGMYRATGYKRDARGRLRVGCCRPIGRNLSDATKGKV